MKRKFWSRGAATETSDNGLFCRTEVDSQGRCDQMLVQVSIAVWHQAEHLSVISGMVWLDTSGTMDPVLRQNEHIVASSIPPSHSGTHCSQPQYESQQSRAGRAGATLQPLGVLLPSFLSVGSQSCDHNK